MGCVSVPKILTFFLLECLVVNLAEGSKDVAEAFTKAGICQDIRINAPQNLVEVSYSNVKVNLGNLEQNKVEFATAPSVTWDANPSDYYTFLMVDLDAPSPSAPTMRSLPHWVVVNVPGCDLSKGKTLNPYILIEPTPELGPHRYVYLVYKQQGLLEDEGLILKGENPADRGILDVAKFAEQYNLGDPLFGNYMLVEVSDKKLKEVGPLPVPF